jgi:hypothetical protein
LHVTATAIVQAHLACMSNLVCATPQVHEQSEHVLVGVITGKLERSHWTNESRYVP